MQHFTLDGVTGLASAVPAGAAETVKVSPCSIGLAFNGCQFPGTDTVVTSSERGPTLQSSVSHLSHLTHTNTDLLGDIQCPKN